MIVQRLAGQFEGDGPSIWRYFYETAVPWVSIRIKDPFFSAKKCLSTFWISHMVTRWRKWLLYLEGHNKLFSFLYSYLFSLWTRFKLHRQISYQWVSDFILSYYLHLHFHQRCRIPKSWYHTCRNQYVASFSSFDNNLLTYTFRWGSS